MIKLPYVLEYPLFEKVDIGIAEALLLEYNDFMGFNKTKIAKDINIVCNFIVKEEAEPENEEQARKRFEHNRQVALDHFEKLFGNKDIMESSLVGLKLDYDTIQKVLLDEFSNKVCITESALNIIAPTIRAAASALLIAERVVNDLRKLVEAGKYPGKSELAVEFAKEGFELLLDGVSKGNVQIPEYYAIKRDINKLKTLEAYIEFCEKLFFSGDK